MLEYHTQHFVSVVRDPRTSWPKIIYHPGLRFLGPFYFVDPCLWSRRWPTCRFYRNINRHRPNIWLHLNISTWKCCLYFSGGIASLHFRHLRGRLHWTDLPFWLNTRTEWNITVCLQIAFFSPTFTLNTFYLPPGFRKGIAPRAIGVIIGISTIIMVSVIFGR